MHVETNAYKFVQTIKLDGISQTTNLLIGWTEFNRFENGEKYK